MSLKPFTLAVCQLRTETEYEETMEKAASMIRSAASSGADAVVLPEMFSCPYSREYFRVFAQRGHQDTLRRMSDWARQNHVLLVGGSVPELENAILEGPAAPGERA